MPHRNSLFCSHMLDCSPRSERSHPHLRSATGAFFVLAALVGVGLFAPACAHDPATQGRIFYVAIPPPPDPVEIEGSAPSPVYVWITGRYDWNGFEYVWIPGQWEPRPHERAVWISGKWTQTRLGWIWVDGHWS